MFTLKILQFSYQAKSPQSKGSDVELPFEIKLDPLANDFYETYSGVFINISYKVCAILKRSMPYRDLYTEQDFEMEVHVCSYES